MSAALTEMPHDLPEVDEVYTVNAPDGRSVRITRAMFAAISEARECKSDGRIVLELRNGGIAGVELQKRFR